MINASRTIKKLIKDFAVRQDNVFYASRLFVANTVLGWIFNNHKDEKMIKHYVSLVEKHLIGEIDLYWDDGVVKVRKEKTVEK